MHSYKGLRHSFSIVLIGQEEWHYPLPAPLTATHRHDVEDVGR